MVSVTLSFKALSMLKELVQKTCASAKNDKGRGNYKDAITFEVLLVVCSPLLTQLNEDYNLEISQILEIFGK